jgi:type I restriction enzyme, S subunit
MKAISQSHSWVSARLGDLGRVVTGKTPPTRAPEYFGGEIPFVTPSDMDGRKTISNTQRYLTRDGLAAVKSSSIPKGAIMVSCIGSDMGKTAVAGENCVTNQQINSIVVAEGFSADFVYYNLSARKTELQNLAGGGSAQPILNKGHFVDLPILLPPLVEQRGIAKVLGTLDDKIELNRRMNETLEGLAKVLFQSLFAATVATELPNGWRTGKLGEVLVAIETGGRPKGGVKDITEGVPSIGAESIVGIGKFDYQKTRFVPRQFFEGMSKGHVVDGDVLLYKDGGRPGEFEPHVTLVDDGFPFTEFCINEHVYRLRSDPLLPQSYLYFWLTSESAMEDMRNRGTGVAIPGLNSTQVRELAVVIPPVAIVNSFDEQVSPLIHRIFANCNESRTLAAVRDALLRKLLSGEVRVTL